MLSITASGNVGREPELRTNKNTGEQFYSLPLAIDQSYTDKNTGQRINATEWTEVILHADRFREVVKFITKGTRAVIIGTPRINTYTNKETKKLVRMFVITADKMDIFNAKRTEKQETT